MKENEECNLVLEDMVVVWVSWIISNQLVVEEKKKLSRIS